ncbi:MAG: hypothetical protein ACQXXH_06170 [Candidatus Bathyarchaeia archaeon]|jgi:hypothetical protein|nr:hypothetical protein [Candidatus Bathyarchaeota archaeon A05DMB-4]MDH7595316.1 hypothetical protein [Candidatus Bathyarchaeota archaeon]
MHTVTDVKKINLINVGGVFVRKWRTLFLDPVGVYYKYKQKLKSKFIKLFGGIPPIYDEDYEGHWNFTSFENKIILDLGADYGSTAFYFLRKGVNKVIAVEGDTRLASKLKLYFQNNEKVVALEEFVDSSKKIETLISKYCPNLIKVDIEGAEKYILGITNAERVNEWLIEAHSNEIHKALATFLVGHGFNVKSFAHANNFKILHASKASK